MQYDIEVQNEAEFNQKIQEFMMQGYELDSNVSGVAILKRKTYNTAVLIILIIFFIIGGIIYYVLSKPDVIMIHINPEQNVFSAVCTTRCSECGAAVLENDAFCHECGAKIKIINELEE